jgi:hypothetical protein
MTRSSTRRHTVALSLALVSSLTLAGCGGSGGSGGSAGGGIAGSAQKDSGAATDKVLKIGLLSTLDGAYAALGQSANQGAKVALVKAGAKLDGTGDRDGITGLTIGGQKVELVVASSDATPDSSRRTTSTSSSARCRATRGWRSRTTPSSTLRPPS